MEHNCTRCGLHQFRRQVVRGRNHEGTAVALPADILFVGEGPGKSEDLRGLAFIGPSGRLLTAAMDKAAQLAKLHPLPTYYITNVVRCRPTDMKGGPNRAPTGEEAWACQDWLEKIILQVRPKQVVFLGKVAAKYAGKLRPGGVALPHPAYLLRKGGRESGEYKAFVRALSNVFRSIGEAS
jgi:uracil-DNA glycosylase family 4